MRYPKFLSENGTIGFTAPSFGCATEPYKTAFVQAQNKLKEKGFSIRLGMNCYSGNGIGISDHPQVCAKDLEEMYCSEDNDILISCGGGELMCEILDYLDFEKLKTASPKWFLGYSDNTNFTFLQNIICDTAAVYGPCAAAFGMNQWHTALEDTFSLLRGTKRKFTGYPMWEKESFKTEENPTPEYNLTETKKLVSFMGQEKISSEMSLDFSGRLIGGCMDCLVSLLGTKFDYVEAFNDRYAEDGIIWFIESCDLNVFAIRRAMWQMDMAGWFKNVKGFLIGRPYVFGQQMMGLDQYGAVMGIIGKYNVPVIMDVDIGHLPPSLPIVSGSRARIHSIADMWDIEYIFD